MFYDCQELEDAKIIRVKKIRLRLQEIEKDILKETLDTYEDLLKNRKYVKSIDIINKRIRVSEAMIKSITTFFFDLLNDSQYIFLTPEIDIFHQVEKFKKNVQTSLRKMTQNLNQGMKGKNKKTQQSDSDQQMGENQGQSAKKRANSKGKNCKIPIDQSWKLTQWLVNNFSYPYPNAAQKQELSKISGLSQQKITNWFINARQRQWKSYFPK